MDDCEINWAVQEIKDRYGVRVNIVDHWLWSHIGVVSGICNPVTKTAHVHRQFLRKLPTEQGRHLLFHEAGHVLALRRKGFWRRLLDGELYLQEEFAEAFATAHTGLDQVDTLKLHLAAHAHERRTESPTLENTGDIHTVSFLESAEEGGNAGS